MLEIAHEVAVSPSYVEAVRRLSSTLKHNVSPSYIWTITNFIGYIVLKQRREIINALIEADKNGNLKETVEQLYSKVDKVDFLYALADGSYINTRIDNINSSEKKTNWRECKLGMAFKPSDLITRRSGKRGVEHYTINKSDYAAHIGRVDYFKYVMLDLMLRNGCKENTLLVFLSDGADWIDNMIEKLIKPLGIKAVHIIDLYHVKENISKFCQHINQRILNCKKDIDSESVFLNAEPLSADDIISDIENGRIDDALSKLEPFKDIKSSKDGIVNAYNYIYSRRDNMKYDYYRSLGYYVGSGPIESANKYFLQSRMKGPGMVWSIECGERILILREYIISQKWDEIVNMINEKRNFLYDLYCEFLDDDLGRVLTEREARASLDSDYEKLID